MQRLPSRTAKLLLTALLVAGCTSRSPEGSDTPSSPAAVDSPPNQTVDLVNVTVDEWRSEIEKLRGEIVVADMWATWCIPCIERFPHMVEMYHLYRSRGVTFVSVCLDDPGDDQAIAQAREFLAEQGATFPNYLITENTADAFEKLDLMTIPAVFVYGPDGTQHFRLTADDPNNQFTDQDVESAIRELLAEQPVGSG